MLSTLRKQTGSIVIKALLVLLIISFGAWGIQDWLSPAISGNFVASVGDQEITQTALQRRVDAQVRRLQTVFGNQITAAQARQFGLVDAALNQLVSRALLTEGANSMGVAIGDDLVRREIRAAKVFRGLGDTFDRERFQRTLQASGLTEQEYIAELRRDMGIEHYADSLAAGADAPSAMVDAIYTYRNEKRVAGVIVVRDADVPEIATPDQATLAAYHTANAKQFTAPEYRKLTLVRLEASALADEIDISEAAIKESYDARADEFSTPERRHVFQMILPTEEKAKQAAGLLSEGQSFAAVAKDLAGQDAGAIDLGTVAKADMLPDLATPVFALAKDAISKPVKSSFGWHLFRVTEIQKGGTKPLADVHDQIKKGLALEKANDSLFDLSNRLEDALGGGATIEEAGRRLGLPVQTIAAIDRRGMNPDGKPVAGIPTANTFLSTAFDVQEGDESPLTEAGQNGFFIVRVDGVTAPALRPLDTVMVQVTSAWKATQRAAEAKARAEKAVESINAGTDIRTVAADLKLTMRETGEFTRTDQGQVSEMASGLVKKVFALMPGKAADERSADGYQVAQLQKIIAASPAANADAVRKVADELSAAMQGDVVAQLGTSLHAQYGAKVNQPLINQLYAAQ